MSSSLSLLLYLLVFRLIQIQILLPIYPRLKRAREIFSIDIDKICARKRNSERYADDICALGFRCLSFSFARSSLSASLLLFSLLFR